jgi:hypothetical protein
MIRVPRLHVLLSLGLLSLPSIVRADKVIMKDGKIYEGRIMGETSRSILITNKRDSQPRFLMLSDVMTIVREKNPEVPNPDRDRYIHVEGMLTGNFYSSDEMSLSPAPGLAMTGGFRMHPLFQVEAGMDWNPGISGTLLVSDGTTQRQYNSFYRYSGGFGLRLFPLYSLKSIPFESYVLGGYRWTRLVAKDSGDFLKGHAWQVGAGISKPLRKSLYWESRVLYERSTYDSIEYLGREGGLSPDIGVTSWSLQTGLSWRL